MQGYYKYWGKAGYNRTDDEKVKPGGHHLLVHHCLDVAACARAFLLQWPMLRQRIASLSGLSEDQVLLWVPFLVALHDFGKFDPAFQYLCQPVAVALGGPPNNNCKYGKDHHHSTMGYVIWEALRDRMISAWGIQGDKDAILGSLNSWMLASTGHHGYPPRVGPSSNPVADARMLLRAPNVESPTADKWTWRVSQDILAWTQDAFTLMAPGPLVLDSKSAAKFRKASHLVSGIAVLADWAGSNEIDFPYDSSPGNGLDAYWQAAKIQAETILQKMNVCPPPISGIGAKTLFQFKRYTPMQRVALTVPLAAGPNLFVLEDMTGSGKTEAAMILASRLVQGGNADGIYFGLPTQATANQISSRLSKPLATLYQSEPWTTLQHSGTKNTGQSYTGLKKISKTHMVSPIGIGTIDQALMGGLTCWHSTVRLTGLCSKVLIIDEMHCYDTYTFGLIRSLVETQTMLGGSTIILSATLPKWMRAEICSAFVKGGGGVSGQSPTSSSYPLCTCVSMLGLTEKVVRKASSRTVPFKMVHDDATLWEGLRKAHAKGWTSCWIRNTVKTAQQAYHKACADFGAHNVILLHSRFTRLDRRRIEQEITSTFGKDSRQADRQGKVLIATQVVEQSLDLDFDFLCSDICTIDTLLQRIGRYRRHRRDKYGNPAARESRGKGAVLVRAPAFVSDPKATWLRDDMPHTANTYRDQVARIWATCRALSVKDKIHLPDDCRPLVDAVYGDASQLDPSTQAPGLQKAVESGNRQDAQKSIQASVNSINPKHGYQSTERWVDIDDVTRMNTRDITATCTLRLAKFDTTGTLVPLMKDVEKAGAGGYWEGSEVICYEQQAAGWHDEVGDERDPVVVARILSQFGMDEDEVVAIVQEHNRTCSKPKYRIPPTVVMHLQSDGSWEGLAFCRERRNNGKGVVSTSHYINYRHNDGLVAP